MNVHTLLRRKGLLGGALAVLMLGTGSTVVAAGSSAPTAGPAIPANAVPLEQARILFELNASGKDIGVQVFLDGDPWRLVKVYDPGGKKLLQIRAHSRFRRLGLTEEFLESNEPKLAKVPVGQFVKRFPKGRYTVVAKSIKGDTMVGIARLSHKIPRHPIVVAPGKNEVTDVRHTVIDWQPVTKPAGIRIKGYEVIVELPNPKTDEAIRVFDVQLPSRVTRVTVPPDFLRRGADFNFEVLAVAANHNQTITEGEFSTAR